MKVAPFRLASPPAFRTQLPAALAAMAAAAHDPAGSAERGTVRRPTLSLALSLALHAFVLSLTFGGQGLGLPGLGLPWDGPVREPVPAPLQVRLSPPPEPASAPTFTSPAATQTIAQPDDQTSTAPADAPAEPPAPSKAVADPPPAQRPEPSAATSPAPATPTPRAAADRAWVALDTPQPDAWSVPRSLAASAPGASLEPSGAAPLDDAELARELQALKARPVQPSQDLTPPVDRTVATLPHPAAASAPDATLPDDDRQELERLLRRALARQETTSREAAQRLARVQAQAQSQDRQEAAAAEAARQESMRLAARAEAGRQALARQEAAQQERVRQEAARAEQARQEATRAEAQRAEARLAEAARQDAARAEAARQEAARQESARQEAARAEAARQEASRAEAARAAAARAEAERLEGERQAAARLEADRQAAAQAAARAAEQAANAANAANAAKAAQLEAAERREARLREIGRQLDQERAQRDAEAASARQSKDLPFASSQRRGRLMGRSDPNPDLVAYGEAWARKIQLDTASFERLREPLRQPHFDALVTVAVRADGSVESVSFVRSSGSPALDAAIERTVRDLAHYPPFPEKLARDYDVIEIRRSWHFDTGIRLY